MSSQSTRIEACPHCGAAITSSTVVCLQCGYNREKGELLQTESLDAADGISVPAWFFIGTTTASIGLLLWFIGVESDSPGMSWAVALIVMDLIVLILGSKLAMDDTSGTLEREPRVLGWIALVFALLGCGFVAAFFLSWIVFFAIWLAVHIALVVAVVKAPEA